MKKIITILIIVLGGVGGYAWYSPYIVIDNIHNGIIEKNPDKITEHIDFPALRESVKVQLLNQLIEKSSQDKGLGALGAMLGSKIVDGLLDTYVTPSGIRSLMEKGKINEDKAREVVYDGEYINYKKFKVSISKPQEENNLSLFMRRDGLSQWKVYDIQLPNNIMKK